jgi:hypothetical protein
MRWARELKIRGKRTYSRTEAEHDAPLDRDGESSRMAINTYQVLLRGPKLVVRQAVGARFVTALNVKGIARHNILMTESRGRHPSN